MKKYLYLLATEKIDGFPANIIKVIMFIVSFFYQFGIYIIKSLYKYKIIRQDKVKAKVISVGNLTLGGTGKTPLEEIVADYLLLKGKNVVILTRGYKAIDSSSDEAMVLKNNLGIIIIEGRDRVIAAKKAISKYNCDTILLDDAFQHWRLFRDLDIITIDSTNPFGNGFTIPRGILREPIKALERSDLVVFTKTDRCKDINALENQISAINNKVAFVYTKHQGLDFINIVNDNRLHYLDFPDNEDICVVCGIADPEYFQHTLKSMGFRLGLSFVFSDHHHYTKEDIFKIIEKCKDKKIKRIVFTQKDAVKLSFLKKFSKDINIELWFLRIKMKLIKNEDVFFKKLDSLYIG